MAKKFAALAVMSSFVLAAALAVACTGKPATTPAGAEGAISAITTVSEVQEVETQSRYAPCPSPTPMPSPGQLSSEATNSSQSIAPTPRQTGYMSGGEPAIKLTITEKCGGMSYVSAAFTAGLDNEKVLAAIRAEEAGYANIEDRVQKALDFWSSKISYVASGSARSMQKEENAISRAGAPFEAGILSVVYDKGRTFLLATRPTGSIQKNENGEYGREGRFAGFTFQWNTVNSSWKFVGIDSYERLVIYITDDHIDEDISTWVDIHEKFFRPIGSADWPFKILNGLAPTASLDVLTPNGITTVDLSMSDYSSLGFFNLAGPRSREEGDRAFKESETRPIVFYDSGLSWGHIARTSRGWLFLTQQIAWRHLYTAFYAQANGKKTWKKKMYPLANPLLKLIVMEEVRGGADSPFGERDVVIITNETTESVLLDEEELFR